MNTRVENRSSEQIIASLRKLITEAEEVLGSDHPGESEETLAGVRERLASGLHSLEGYYTEAKRRVVAGAHRTDEVIRSHPYQSLAVALGVGVLIGALIRRK